MAQPTFVSFTALRGGTILVDATDQIADLVAVPVSSLNGAPNGTYINFGSGRVVAVQGTPTTVAAALQAGGGTTPLGPWSSVLYVDNVRGSDVTGTRGNDNLPFATIQAALNAAQDGDTIELAPQAFQLTAALTRPASLTSFTVSAYAGTLFGGSGTTIQQNTAGQAVFDLSVNLGLATCILRNMTLVAASGADSTIFADGSAYAQGVYLFGLELDRVDLVSGNVTLKYVAEADIFGGTWNNSLLSITSCGLVELYGVRAPDVAVTNTYDADDPKAVGFAWGLEARQSTVIGGASPASVVTLTKQAHLVVDQTSMIGGLKGSGLTVNGGATAGPSVQCAGFIAAGNSGAVDFASAGSELPDTTLALTFDFRGTRFWGSTIFSGITAATVAKFKVGGAAVHSQNVLLDDCAARPGFTVTADANIALTARGATLPSAVYTTPGATGSIVPPMLSGTINLGASVGARTWVQLGYAGLVRTGSAPDSAFVTPSVAATDPCITARATTGLTFGGNVVAGNTAASWLCIWK